MADDKPTAHQVQEALAILGQIRGGNGVDLNAMAARSAELDAQKRAILGWDDALPMIGGTAGDIAGSRFGTPGRIVGSTVGAMAGRAVNPLAYGLFGNTAPSPTGSRLGDVLAEGAGALGGEVFGMTANAAGRRLIGSQMPTPDPRAAATAQAFQATGVPMKVSDVSARVSPMERSLAQTPTGGNIIRGAQERQASMLNRAADEFLNRIAPPQAGERTVVGQRVSDAIQARVRQSGAIEDHLWQQMGQMAHDLPVPIDRLRLAAEQVILQERRGLRPNQNLVGIAEQILSHGNAVAWQAADAWRKNLGRMVNTGELISQVPSGEARLLYRELLGDMEQAAGAATTPGVGQAYAFLRQFSEHRRALFRDGEAARLLEADPEEVVRMLNLGGGPSAIRRAREAIIGSPELGRAYADPADRETWDYVRRHILEGVFRGATRPEFKGLQTAVISGADLGKALDKFGRDSLNELLTDTERQALTNIATVARAIRQSEKVGALPGTSATPQGMNFADLFRNPGVMLGTAAGGLLGGAGGAATGGAVGGFLSMVLVPHIAANLITNPRAAEIIASRQFGQLAQVGQMTSRAAREASIAAARALGQVVAQEIGQ